MSDKKWDRKYIKGSARKVDFSSGHIINVSVRLEDLKDAPDFCVKKAKNGDKYLQFSVATVKEGEDSYGNTHNVFFSFPEGESSESKEKSSKKEDEDWEF